MTSRVLICKDCKDKYKTLTCSVCGKEYRYEGDIKHIEYYRTHASACKSCYNKAKEKYNKPMHIICRECSKYVGVSSQFSLCPECNKPVLPKELVGEIYGRTYTGTHKTILPRQHSIYGSCRTNMKKSVAVKEFESLLESGWNLTKDGTVITSPKQANLSGDGICKKVMLVTKCIMVCVRWPRHVKYVIINSLILILESSCVVILALLYKETYG